MYPNLLTPLGVAVGLVVVSLLFVAVRHPVSRRLAMRQLARRRSEAALAITGAALGTAIIMGALVVGDTLNLSVRQEAYRTLGPVDERIVSASAVTGDVVAAKLSPLRADPRIDGVLSAHVDQAAALSGTGASSVAEPRVLAWDVDLPAAAAFGRGGGPSGLGGPNPASGQIVVNQPLAHVLRLKPGGSVTIFLYGKAHRYTVSRVVAERGLAGTGQGATVNRNVFLPPGDLDAAARAVGARPRAMTWVSNRGGVERGVDLTTAVAARIRDALVGTPALVETPKRSVLDAARKTGDSLGALFLMIGSFSIIAGALLLVNIFVMLAEERKPQLGVLRAIGMKRKSLIESFSIEGATYAVVATLPGIVLGIGIGWVVAIVSAQIFQAWSADGAGLTIRFAVTPVSVINASMLGLVIALVTVIATSVRLSRFNIIAAIRDLPRTSTSRTRRITLIATTLLAAAFALMAVPAVAASQAETTLLLPSIAAALLTPAIRGLLGARWAITVIATAVLAWAMVATVVRPHMFDNPSMAIYVIQGSLVAFSGVALVSQNQTAILRPLRRLIERPTEGGLAARLAVAYPVAKRFRTGATLVMYTLITLVLVLLVEITGVINASVDKNVANATAGYALRLDVNPADSQAVFASLRTGQFSGQVSSVTTLVSASALATDPGHRSNEPIQSVVVGVPNQGMGAMTFESRLAGLRDDRAVWNLVARDGKYVVLDQFFGATGGPNGRFYGPGDTFALTDPRTGRSEQKTIAGILTNAMAFYPAAGDGANRFPVVGSATTVREMFGAGAQVRAAFIKTRGGVDPEGLAPAMQAQYLSASLVATPIASNVRRMFSANTAFFRLMQGFLALGLLVGITGLGVVMVRAVRERRRTIGVLRALGFQARTVERSFLLESAFIAIEGVVLGALLGVLTTWLMYQKSAQFDGVRSGFPIEWGTILALVGATLVASIVATLAPARRAAQVRPAVAVRVAN
jgi:putative ABC transport system permease protein